MASSDEQFDRLERRLMAIPQALRQRLGPVLDKVAAEIAASARTLAPDDDGTLAATIHVEPGRHELSRAIVAGGTATTKPVEGGVSATYDYALAQELGTKHQKPNRFLRPAERIRRRRNRARLQREAKKIIVAEFGKS